MKTSPRHVAICGLNIPVRVGTPKDCADLAGAYGCYDVDTATIWLNADTPAHAASFWFVHEILHALLNLSGLLYATARIFGVERDSKQMEEWEEITVRVLTPHVLETFGAALRARGGR